MARSLQEIMDSADALAALADGGEHHGAPLASGDDPWLDLKLAAFKRAQAEKDLAAAVRAARQHDLSWEEIGRHIGLTGEAVRRRYGDLVGLQDNNLERSVLRSVGQVPDGGRIEVSRSNKGAVTVTVVNRRSQPVRQVRNAKVVRFIATKNSLMVRGKNVPVERKS